MRHGRAEWAITRTSRRGRSAAYRWELPALSGDPVDDQRGALGDAAFQPSGQLRVVRAIGIALDHGAQLRPFVGHPDHELAAAQGFPTDYSFAGNKSEVVKQIGNSVCVGTSRALCGELIGRCA